MAGPEQQICKPVKDYEAGVQKQNKDYGKEYGHLMLPDSISMMSRMRGKEPAVDQSAVDKALGGARESYNGLSASEKAGLSKSANPVASAVTGEYNTPDIAAANNASLSDLRSACKDVPIETAQQSPGGATATKQIGAGQKVQDHACRIEEASGGDCSKMDTSSTLGKERLKI